MTPVPSFRHQHVLGELYAQIKAACPAGFTVLFASFAVALAKDTELRPDLLVARTADSTARDLPQAPLPAVEVLSASTRRVDLTLKRDRLEAAGCDAYWSLDPEILTLTVWQLKDGRLVKVGTAEGDEDFTTDRPFPLSIRPGSLIDTQT